MHGYATTADSVVAHDGETVGPHGDGGIGVVNEGAVLDASISGKKRQAVAGGQADGAIGDGWRRWAVHTHVFGVPAGGRSRAFNDAILEDAVAARPRVKVKHAPLPRLFDGLIGGEHNRAAAQAHRAGAHRREVPLVEIAHGERWQQANLFVRQVVEFLRRRFTVQQPQNWTDGYASFADERSYELPFPIGPRALAGVRGEPAFERAAPEADDGRIADAGPRNIAGLDAVG